MNSKPFVFYNISKTYKVYDINLSLRKLKGPRGERQGMSERSEQIPP